MIGGCGRLLCRSVPKMCQIPNLGTNGGVPTGGVKDRGVSSGSASTLPGFAARWHHMTVEPLSRVADSSRRKAAIDPEPSSNPFRSRRWRVTVPPVLRSPEGSNRGLQPDQRLQVVHASSLRSNSLESTPLALGNRSWRTQGITTASNACSFPWISVIAVCRQNRRERTRLALCCSDPPRSIHREW